MSVLTRSTIIDCTILTMIALKIENTVMSAYNAKVSASFASKIVHFPLSEHCMVKLCADFLGVMLSILLLTQDPK